MASVPLVERDAIVADGRPPDPLDSRAMRIIAGEFRGRKLLPPEGDMTRPITDRVKQSLFDILAPPSRARGSTTASPARAAWGWNGSAAGRRYVTFFEADRSAVARLKKNIAAFGVADRDGSSPGDLFRWFERPTPRHDRGSAADLVFLDPPYRFLHERPDDCCSSALTRCAPSPGRRRHGRLPPRRAGQARPPGLDVTTSASTAA